MARSVDRYTSYEYIPDTEKFSIEYVSTENHTTHEER